VSNVPFSVRRPGLLLQGIFTNRDQPDFAKLAALTDPEAFLWAILPHAARTFAACIVILPEEKARVAAVGYLYARILDTYEDLMLDPKARHKALLGFVQRFNQTPGAPLPDAPHAFDTQKIDARDRGHLLLVQCCNRIDAVYLTLSQEHQNGIQEMIQAMAPGMANSSALFQQQGGALETLSQREDYCDVVLGNPLALGLRIAKGSTLTYVERSSIQKISIFIQLANITRDIEKDCLRGICYHPALKTYLGKDAPAELYQQIRGDLLSEALQHANSFREVANTIPARKLSLVRSSALMMVLFTDRYYRFCAKKAGRKPWQGISSTLAILCQSFLAIFSTRYADRKLNLVLEKHQQHIQDHPPPSAVAK